MPVWLPALLLTITCAANVWMAHAKSFSKSTLEDLSNGIKNTSRRSVWPPAIELWIFGSPRGLRDSRFPLLGVRVSSSHLPQSGVATVWLPTTKSRESTRPRCVQMECDTSLESSQRELQVYFRPHPRSKQKVMNSQSPWNLNRDSFETPPWESRDKKPFRCGCRGITHRILYGGRWWLPLSLGHGESCESKVARSLS